MLSFLSFISFSIPSRWEAKSLSANKLKGIRVKHTYPSRLGKTSCNPVPVSLSSARLLTTLWPHWSYFSSAFSNSVLPDICSCCIVYWEALTFVFEAQFECRRAERLSLAASVTITLSSSFYSLYLCFSEGEKKSSFCPFFIFSLLLLKDKKCERAYNRFPFPLYLLYTEHPVGTSDTYQINKWMNKNWMRSYCAPRHNDSIQLQLSTLSNSTPNYPYGNRKQTLPEVNKA